MKPARAVEHTVPQYSLLRLNEAQQTVFGNEEGKRRKAYGRWCLCGRNGMMERRMSYAGASDDRGCPRQPKLALGSARETRPDAFPSAFRGYSQQLAKIPRSRLPYPFSKSTSPKMPLFPFSEDTKERIIRTVAVVHNVVHYGWVPFVLFVGYSRSTPRPSLIK